MSVLKEFIRKTLLEDEVLLKKWAKGIKRTHTGGIEDDEAQLLDLGLTPIPRGRGSSFIGAGEYQRAYDVVWNGKRVVAKLTRNEDDVEKTVKLNDIKQKLPSDKSKHIMTVYDVIDYIDEDLGDVSYCVLVEHLQPLSTKIVQDLYGDEFTEDENPYKEEEISSITFDDIESVTRHTLEGLTFQDFPVETFETNDFRELVKVMYDATIKPTKIRAGDYTSYEVNMNLEPRMLSKVKDIAYNNNIQLQSKTIVMMIVDDINDLLKRETFPFSSHDSEWKKEKVRRHPDKRVSEFIEFLQYLENEFGILWADVHQENIMMRPRTGDLVISDPGLFMMEDD